jgi:hypothetical protein
MTITDFLLANALLLIVMIAKALDFARAVLPSISLESNVDTNMIESICSLNPMKALLKGIEGILGQR